VHRPPRLDVVGSARASAAEAGYSSQVSAASSPTVSRLPHLCPKAASGRRPKGASRVGPSVETPAGRCGADRVARVRSAKRFIAFEISRPSGTKDAMVTRANRGAGPRLVTWTRAAKADRPDEAGRLAFRAPSAASKLPPWLNKPTPSLPRPQGAGRPRSDPTDADRKREEEERLGLLSLMCRAWRRTSSPRRTEALGSI
jgi:plasmid stabilization system protein ParE